jgi:hypothetical protein
MYADVNCVSFDVFYQCHLGHRNGEPRMPQGGLLNYFFRPPEALEAVPLTYGAPGEGREGMESGLVANG